MQSLFEFTDFRAYLKHYYEDKKRENPHFSYLMLAQKSGITNKGFIFNIVQGTKKLSKSHCYKLSQALGHTKKEAEYFEYIVAYAQAKNEEERSWYLKKALDCMSSTHAKTRLLNKDHYEYYATWYHSAIRALIEILPVEDQVGQICQRLIPAVTVGQVRRSLLLLERLELIGKGKDGRYILTDASIRTSKEIAQTARNQFHIECAELAKKAIQHESPEERHVVSITLGITEKTYGEIVNETKTFVNTLVNIVNSDSTLPERVYQYELLLFPLTRRPGKDRKNEK